MRIGKQSTYTVAAGTVVQILFANPHRRAVLLSPIPSTNALYTFGTKATLTTVGVLLEANATPVLLRWEDFGDLVTWDAWVGNGTGSPQSVTILEGLEG